MADLIFPKHALDVMSAEGMMRLEYDEQVDAAFVDLDGPIEPGAIDATERLDEDRFVKYDAGDRIIRYELLNVRRFGVRLADLEHRDELARLFGEAGFRERDGGEIATHAAS